VIALSLGLAGALFLGQERKAQPAEAEQRALVAEYLELEAEGRSGAVEGRQAEILAELAAVPALSAAQARSWAKRIQDGHRGERLASDSGFHELADGRRYFLGGKTTRPKGILLHLHGGRTPDFENPTPQSAFRLVAQAEDWAFVMPLLPEGREWADPEGERLVIDLLDSALRTWSVEPGRVLLSGSSAGAIGAWPLAARHADRFAALAAFSGGPLAPFPDRGMEDGLLPNLRHVPIAMFHSALDPLTPVSAARSAAEKLRALHERFGSGYTLHYTEMPGSEHGAPKAGAGPIYAPIADARRVARPRSITWQPSQATHARFYWLECDEPRVGALITADFDPEGRSIALRAAEGIRGLALLLDDALLDLEREVRVTLNGVEVFRGRAERRLTTLLQTGALGDPELTFSARVPVALR
jgi:predicted esterase